MEGLSLDLPLLFKAVDNILVAPSNFMRQPLEFNLVCVSPNPVDSITLTVQYFRPGFSRSTLKASGTTMRFFLSYGGGTPSNNFKRSKAAAPRGVLWGTMPLMARYSIFEGAR